MTTLPYILGDESLTVIIDSQPLTIARSVPQFPGVMDLLSKGDLAEDEVGDVRNMMLPREALNTALGGTGVEIIGNAVCYLGQRIPGTLEKRLLDLAAIGVDVTMWKRFVANCYANPSDVARRELFDFLAAGDLPITDDGCFVAYKYVMRSDDPELDWKDVYSGTYDNSPGAIPEMDRDECDPSRTNTCSAGLHFCQKRYLAHMGGTNAETRRVVAVKVNPADVTAIPVDYGQAKGRCCRYEVLYEIDIDNEDLSEWGLYMPVATEPQPEPPAITFDPEDLGEAQVTVTHVDHFEAPAPPTASFWRAPREWVRSKIRG